MPASRNSPASPVRLAVVGAGLIGKKHSAMIAAERAASLVGIVDPAPAAAAIADEHETELFASMSELLDRGRPDGVIVATPTDVHLGPTLEALDAGAHVLVEKPIAATREEAAAIVARAAAVGRQVLVGHHRRYNPVLDHAREIIWSGEIGPLTAVHGQWTVRKPDAYFELAWHRFTAGGPVMTNLVHELDTLRHICGEIASVAAMTSNQPRSLEKEDVAAVLISFACGAIGTFLLSDATPSPWTWEQATGENPAFPVCGQSTHRLLGVAGALEFPTLTIWRHANGGVGWNDPLECRTTTIDEVDVFARQCAHFCAVIRGEEQPKVTAADAARTLDATLAVLESARAGRRIDL